MPKGCMVQVIVYAYAFEFFLVKTLQREQNCEQVRKEKFLPEALILNFELLGHSSNQQPSDDDVLDTNRTDRLNGY